MAIEQRQEFLGPRLGATADHQRQAGQAWGYVGLQHGAVIGDDRDPAVLLPERERDPLLDADLQLAGIELEHGRIGDPRIGLEPLARVLDVQEQQRGGAGDARGGEHLIAAEMVIADERERDDAEARRIGEAVARVPERGDQGCNMLALDGAVGQAGQHQGSGSGGSRPAREPCLEQQGPALQEPPEAAPRRATLRVLAGRATGPRPWHDPCHRSSEASSIIHRTSSSNAIPACAAISGTSDVSVMPGCVLTSRQTSPPVPSIRSS